MPLTIKKDQIIYTNYNEEPINVKKYIINFLNEKTEIDDNITLKDIFNIINDNIDVLDVIIGNWCEEIIKQALNSNNQKEYNINELTKNDIEYLELYKTYNLEEPSTFGYISFHGIGIILQEEYEYHNIGDRINYSLSMTDAEEIINIPIKLNNDIIIYEDYKEIYNIKNDETNFTLLDILYNIVWELSFFGPPEKKQEFKEKLMKRMENIKNDPSYKNFSQ